MFWQQMTNDWGEVVYMPTTLGTLLLVVLMLVLVLCASLVAQKLQTKEEKKERKAVYTVKQMTFCAICMALGMILSTYGKVFKFPTGGSITLFSMLAMTLPGYFFGLVPGLIAGVAYGVLQLVVDPYVLFPTQLVVDYILAFGALGLSGLFSNSKYGLVKGYVAGIFGRFVFAVLSGWIFFGAYAWEGWNPLPYSLAYNAIYIFSEAAITVVVLMIPAVSKAMKIVKDMANS